MTDQHRDLLIFHGVCLLTFLKQKTVRVLQCFLPDVLQGQDKEEQLSARCPGAYLCAFVFCPAEV